AQGVGPDRPDTRRPFEASGARACLVVMVDRVRILLARGLLVVGAALLVWWLWVAVDGLAFEATVNRRLQALDRPVRSRPLVKVARATRKEAEASGVVGRIEIPRLRLSAPVVEGTSDRALRRGVGHVERTAFPGERGNVGLAGHRDTWFRGLKEVERGDLIRLRTPDGSFVYAVEAVRIVDPERGDLLHATHRPRLTLVTCFPFKWVGPAPQRFVVLARPFRPATDDKRAALLDRSSSPLRSGS
ncbi:MAG: class D sortase, partial [Candidatus Eiseniibacteriota bacterium]